MPAGLALWIGCVVIGAAWLALHLVTLMHLWLPGRAGPSPWWPRAAALLPPALPWLAWRAGLRGRALGWLVLGACYAALWTAAR